MDRFTDDTRFSDYSADTYEQKPAMDYSLQNELRKTIQRQKKTIFSLAERNRVWKIICFVLVVLLVIESVLLWVNSNEDTPHIPDASQVQTGQGEIAEQPSVEVPPSHPVNEERIEEILSQMTLVDKIHQMMFVTPEELTGFESVTAAGESTEASLAERKVGGIIYNDTNIEGAEQLTSMLTNTADYAVTPVFLGYRRNSGSIISGEGFELQSQTVIGTYSEKNKIAEEYAACAEEMASFGFNLNFGTSTELVSGSGSGVVGSFGSDATAVSDAVSMAVKGQLMHNVSTALGAFPTDTNAQHTAEQLRSSEFVVYKSGIDSGADFVTVSHKVNTALDGEGVPYSMSKGVVTELLCGELAFDGIVITAPMTELEYTDELTCGQAVAKCIKAGVNMIMNPVDFEETVIYINEAVRVGELDVSLIDDSVKRILRVKQRRGLIE